MLRILNFWIIILSMRLSQIEARHELNITESRAIIHRIFELKEKLTELASPYVKITVIDVPPNCVQMQCKFICFNGKSHEIEKDIEKVLESSRIDCLVLEELRLYNYDFPNGIIPRNFLGGLSDKIQSLYIATSNVTEIEGGAFGNGIFQKLAFENLKLIELRRDFFENISSDFSSLSVVQVDPPLMSICQGFLDLVQTQIKSLTLQIGISCVRNMTASNNLLSNLAYVDYSFNNFGSNFTPSTFSMLSMVEHLDLSHSKITSLPKYIFSNFASTLVYLDISQNYLKTISTNIFGWHKTRNDLKIYATGNAWDCGCELHSEMKELFAQPSHKIVCATPEEYCNWSVFDDRLCGNATSTSTTTPTSTSTPTPSTTMTMTKTKTTTTIITTTKMPFKTTSSPPGSDTGGGSIEISEEKSTPSTQLPKDNDIELTCRHNTEHIKVLPPRTDFDLSAHPNLRVDVILKVISLIEEEYGLVWFSKVTNEFYKMEINYKEYGLGCYGSISYYATVDDLLPNVAYTFCLVKKNQPTVSPFSCKSVHIPGNVNIRYAWLTRDFRTTGISLTIFAVVLCTFVGILITFLILKQKPILLKGSKRVATTKGNGNEIVVLPKDRSLDELRIKEEMLAKRSSKSNISCMHPRRPSTESNISYQSYMNTNLYEELPAYINIEPSVFPAAVDDSTYNYVNPHSIDSSRAHLFSYAEIPFRHKRTSNDPLLEVPKEETSQVEPSPNSDDTDIFRHKFDLSTGYALAYDCVV